MGGPDDKDETLSPKPEESERTTPFGTPEPSQATTDLDPSAPALRPLTERYDLLGELGRGGMGAVYKARDRETGDIVALKVLLPEIAARPELIERFKVELLLARKITHKNVCRVYDLNRFGSVAAISMEYIEGESLRALLKRQGGYGLSVRQGLDILRQVQAGLAEAHARGVVHRDLKPENILIATDGTVKVMDFGIARSLETGATKTGTLIGTPAYMSPEQVEGKPVDARSDLYALGLMMYELFTGRLAFQADTPVAAAMKRLQEPPPPARALEPDLPERLDRALQKCLEKNPKKRFQSIAELETALSEQPAAAPLPEEEPVPAPHLSRWARWDWALLAVGALGLFYFLEFRDAVFPASQMRLEVDAITARRQAEDLAIEFGRPFPEQARARLEFDAPRYRNLLLEAFPSRSPTGIADPFEKITRVEFPLQWRVSFAGEQDSWLQYAGGAPPRYAVVDRQGEVLEFSHPFPPPPETFLTDYQPPPVEERRRIAIQAGESVCGPLPSRVRLVERAGGEWGAAYTATWRPLRWDEPPWGRVSLWTEQVVGVKCNFRGESLPPQTLIGLGVQGYLRTIFRVGLIFSLLIPFFIYFAVGQCHRSPLLWKRLPLAVVLGVAGVWVLGPGLAGTGLSWLAFLVGSAAASGVFLIGIVTIEHYLRRRAPESLASYALALRGRVTQPSVGMALVRGALAGLVLAALETLWVHMSFAWLVPLPWERKNEVTQTLKGFFTVFLDPTSVGQAGAGFSPALFVVAAAVFSGILVGLILMGSVRVTSHKDLTKLARTKRGQLLFLGMGASALAVGTVGLDVPVGHYLGLAIAFILGPFFLGLWLGWVFLRYDILTVVMTVATAVVWTLNYPLLELLKEVGNGPQWGVFVGWGGVVGAAAFVAFRAQIIPVLQQKKAEFE